MSQHAPGNRRLATTEPYQRQRSALDDHRREIQQDARALGGALQEAVEDAQRG